MASSHFFLRGEIDIVSVPALRGELRRVADASSGELVIDCYDTTFLDAAGVGMLVELRESLRSQGRTICLTNVHTAAERILMVVGLYDVLVASRSSHTERDWRTIVEWCGRTRDQSRRLCAAAHVLQEGL